MTKNQLITEVKNTMIKPALRFNTINKLKSSGYFVECVKQEIGKIAFNADYELTVKEETEILNELFS